MIELKILFDSGSKHEPIQLFELQRDVANQLPRPQISRVELVDSKEFVCGVETNMKAYARSSEAKLSHVQHVVATAVANDKNVVILGNCGVGKTAISASIGAQLSKKCVISVVATRALQLSQCHAFSKIFKNGMTMILDYCFFVKKQTEFDRCVCVCVVMVGSGGSRKLDANDDDDESDAAFDDDNGDDVLLFTKAGFGRITVPQLKTWATVVDKPDVIVVTNAWLCNPRTLTAIGELKSHIGLVSANSFFCVILF